MRRIEDLITKVITREPLPGSVACLCDSLVEAFREDHPLLINVFSRFNRANLHPSAPRNQFLEAHVCACRALGFNDSLTLEVCISLLASHGEASNKCSAILNRKLGQLENAAPAIGEAWPKVLQLWANDLVRKNQYVEHTVRAEVFGMMNRKYS